MSTVSALFAHQDTEDGLVSMNDIPRSAVYTPKQVAAMLGLARALVYELLNTGQIPAKRLGKRWIIPRAVFDTWLNNVEKGQ